MRVFEHCEACPKPWGGGTLTRSMRRVANATLIRFGRYNEPRDARSDNGYLTTDAVWGGAMRVFEHCEARSVPCGGGTVTRSMRRDANATPLQFDRYDKPPDSRTETPNPITDI